MNRFIFLILLLENYNANMSDDWEEEIISDNKVSNRVYLNMLVQYNCLSIVVLYLKVIMFSTRFISNDFPVQTNWYF